MKRLSKEIQILLIDKKEVALSSDKEIEDLSLELKEMQGEKQSISEEYDHLRERIVKKLYEHLEAWRDREELMVKKNREVESKLSS